MRGRRAPAETEAGELRQAPAWQSFTLSHREEWDLEGPQPAGGTNTEPLPSLSTHNSPVIVLIIRTVPLGGGEGQKCKE